MLNFTPGLNKTSEVAMNDRQMDTEKSPRQTDRQMHTEKSPRQTDRCALRSHSDRQMHT